MDLAVAAVWPRREPRGRSPARAPSPATVAAETTCAAVAPVAWRKAGASPAPPAHSAAQALVWVATVSAHQRDRPAEPWRPTRAVRAPPVVRWRAGGLRIVAGPHR